MAARTASMICRTATTFTPDGELDEDALRQFLQRFVNAKLGIYLASGGSGEGHALSLDEIRRVYEIGVEVCRGKVAVTPTSRSCTRPRPRSRWLSWLPRPASR